MQKIISIYIISLGASKIYYISLRDSARRKESGKDKDHADRSRRQSRRRERAGRLKQSLKTAKDDKLEGLDKKKLASVLSPEYMSSEESDVDSEGVFVSFKVRRLPWQTEAFKKVKDNLEEAHKSKLSPQHLRQVKKRRVVELPSMRPAPQGCPGFILREEEER
ncbi:uncharacterized protein LOC134275667 [Saccostrea cucullata]|uniref:uncharacterized protein LOC134275667 n=1 Tax=Saccostrea cuccullata TaxID=36930 RepID=UPI002ED506A0